MFRIRRIFDDSLPVDQRAVAQVQEIIRAQFPGARPEDSAGLADKLRNPLKYQFRHLLFVADDSQGTVRGFALVAHEPQLRFFFLDYIATGKQLSGGGVGGALYARVRDEAQLHDVVGIFFECLPDEAAECESAAQCRENAARLRFYEQFGARPIANTAYQKPVKPDDRCLPFLVFDGLDRGKTLRRDAARAACRAILERKYAYLCPPAYVREVVASFHDDPVRLRPFRYVKPTPVTERPHRQVAHERVLLVVNDKHDIHHIRERGYVEAPVRIAAIRKELDTTGLFHEVPPREFPEAHIHAIHDDRFVNYLKLACRQLPAGKSLYPYVFPVRNAARPPKEFTVRAGYYCIDTFTPLNQNAFPAAKRATDCALTAATALLAGERLAYALVRPPGHHAEHAAFGGFCYFNNCGVAAHFLSRTGPVAILDIDYHHGNGQQEIFYERSDVLTVSIHGHPEFAYPYFSGFEDEKGAKAGQGFNVNFPLPEKIDAERYRQVLARALERVRKFAPRFLIVALGLDTAKSDPTGTWPLVGRDFEANGRLIGALHLPTLVVQEGGYRTRTLGVNARHFFVGLVQAAFGPHAPDASKTTLKPAPKREAPR